MLTYVKWAFWTLLAAFVASFLHYTLPQHDIVRVVGTENRRVTEGANSIFWSNVEVGSGANDVRDVFFIQATYPSGRAIVYRNEDTGWGWPPYFKFNAADLQASAQNLVSTESAPRWIAVRHYGWRNQLFNIYPNAMKVWEVPGPDTRIIPWFTIIFLTGLLAIVWAITARVIKWRKKRLEPALDRLDQRIEARKAGISRWFHR